MEKTKIIVLKDQMNAGKTTTMWLLLMSLKEQNASVRYFYNYNEDKEDNVPNKIPQAEYRFDFVAVLEWHDKVIVLDSRGDYAKYIVGQIRWALTNDPDYIVCAIQCRDYNNIWARFDRKFPNTQYQRVCFGVEKAEDEENALLVKQPTVEAIMKYMA